MGCSLDFFGETLGVLSKKWSQWSLQQKSAQSPKNKSLQRSIVVEMSKASTNEGGTAHLPHQPVLALCPGWIFPGEKLPFLVELVAQIQQDWARLENPHGFGRVRIIQHGRDLGVRIDCIKARGKLHAVDGDEPRVILKVWKGLNQFLQQDGNLHTIPGRPKDKAGISLQVLVDITVWWSESKTTPEKIETTPCLFTHPTFRSFLPA